MRKKNRSDTRHSRARSRCRETLRKTNVEYLRSRNFLYGNLSVAENRSANRQERAVGTLRARVHTARIERELSNSKSFHRRRGNPPLRERGERKKYLHATRVREKRWRRSRASVRSSRFEKTLVVAILGRIAPIRSGDGEARDGEATKIRERELTSL